MKNGKYIRLWEQQSGPQQESVGLQAVNSDTCSLEGEEVPETKGSTQRPRRTRRQVQFREGAKSTDKVCPRRQVQLRR